MGTDYNVEENKSPTRETELNEKITNKKNEKNDIPYQIKEPNDLKKNKRIIAFNFFCKKHDQAMMKVSTSPTNEPKRDVQDKDRSPKIESTKSINLIHMKIDKFNEEMTN